MALQLDPLSSTLQSAKSLWCSWSWSPTSGRYIPHCTLKKIAACPHFTNSQLMYSLCIQTSIWETGWVNILGAVRIRQLFLTLVGILPQQEYIQANTLISILQVLSTDAASAPIALYFIKLPIFKMQSAIKSFKIIQLLSWEKVAWEIAYLSFTEVQVVELLSYSCNDPAGIRNTHLYVQSVHRLSLCNPGRTSDIADEKWLQFLCIRW